MKSIILAMCCFPIFCISSKEPSFLLSWPTPNPSFAQGLGYSTFLQKTGPDKKFSSGAYGCVRNNGYKFHEGIDLFPVKRTRDGRAEDKVFASISGVVRHINSNSSYSSYGKYLVLEHPNLNPPIYTLYAHLAEISKTLKIGSNVEVATPLGVMGNTSSSRMPINRSHLHFEIGLRLTDQFQKWFDAKPFSTKNKHGNFNGLNLIGLDPLHFFSEYKKKSFSQPIDYLSSLPVILKLRVRGTGKIPDFANRYPSLTHKPNENTIYWDCSFGPFGVPVKIQPSLEQAPDSEKIKIISYDLKIEGKPCRKLLVKKGKTYTPSQQLQSYIELLFGL